MEILKPLLLAIVAAAGAQAQFSIHAFHKQKFGGTLSCELCHTPVTAGSVMLKRPGHEQCAACHSEDFEEKPASMEICAQCHSSRSPAAADLRPFPGRKTVGFSHVRHIDPKARVNAASGFRADCSFCHRFAAQAAFATPPTHEQCAACHAKPGMKAQFSNCVNCHKLESAPPAPARRTQIAFSHAAHFKDRERSGFDCTTCHYAILNSSDIRTAAPPMMIDCVQCHDSAVAVTAEFRIWNCRTCHMDNVAAQPTPGNHVRNVKPDFHTEAFRRDHEAEAAAKDAKCFACHQNVEPVRTALNVKARCAACHQTMRPANHTARWKDDLHGKYAALDRTECATCHTAAYCSDCHNELPRSHQPLPVFKAGAHAFSARLEIRACLTCHTFQNTCSGCHTKQFAF